MLFMNSVPDNMNSIPRIPEFFARKTVLITGCTGFLGKVLLEKLIRSCPDIDTIYLIIKPKSTDDPQARLKNLINLPLFDVCRSQKPGFESKLIAVEGDLSKLQLGLSDKDYTTLAEKVNIVFHVAATVRFNEALYDAIKINTRGTKEVVDLCLKMKFLQGLVYVSTAYSNCDKKEINETIYPSHVDWEDAIKISEKIDPAVINILQEKFIGPMPNTYVLTKNIAEHVIQHYAHRLPVAIVRPSIVIATWQEPFPGWVDNFNGPVGLFIAYGSALLKTFMGSLDAIPDYVPVDVAVKNIIIAAWKTAVLGSQQPSGIVYNCATVFDSKVTFKDVIQVGRGIINKFPLSRVIWLPKKPRLVTNKIFFRMCIMVESLPFAALIDIILKIKGQKPILVKIVRKIYQGSMLFSHFTSYTWDFRNQNFVSLNKIVLPEDKEHFYSDYDSFDYEDNYKNGIFGGKKYLLNDDEKNIPINRKRLVRMYWLEKVLQVAGTGLLLWMINAPAWIQRFVNAAAVF